MTLTSRILLNLFVLGAVVWFLCPPFNYAQDANEGARLFNEGKSLLKSARSKDDLKQAGINFEKAHRIFVLTGHMPEASLAANEAGYAYYSLGDIKGAVGFYEKSLAIKEKISDIPGQVSSLFNLADSNRMLGDLDSHQKYLFRLGDVCAKIRDPKCEVMKLNGLGLNQKLRGNNQAALEHYKKALDLSDQPGFEIMKASILNNVGNVYFSLADYNKSNDCFMESLAICKQAGDTKNVATVLNQLSGSQFAMGQMELALKSLEESLEITRRAGSQYDEAVILHNMGHYYELLGFFDKGLELLNQSAEMKQKISDIQGLAETLAVTGTLYQQIGNYTKSIEALNKSRELKKSAKMPYYDADIGMARLYLELGDLDKAAEKLESAQSFVLEGALALKKKELDDAEKSFAQELEKSTKSNDLIGLFESNTGLGIIYEQKKEFEKAKAHFQQAIDNVEKLRDSLPDARRSNFYDSAVRYFKRITPYKGMTRVLLKMGDNEGSFQFAESSKARAFSEAMSSRSKTQSQNVPQKVLDEDKDINLEYAGSIKGLEVAQKSPDKTELQKAEKRFEEAKAKRNTYIARLRKDFPIFAASKYPLPMPAGQLKLSPDEWALEYDVTDSGMCIYLLNGPKVVHAELKPVTSEELLSLVRKFRSRVEVGSSGASIVDQLKNFDFDTGQKLYSILLGDVAARIPKNSVVFIVPDDILGALPFEMLSQKNDAKVNVSDSTIKVEGADFFGDRYNVIYSQSLSAMTIDRSLQKEPNKETVGLLFADPVFQLSDLRSQQVKAHKTASKNSDFYVDAAKTMASMEGTGVRFDRLERTASLDGSLKEIFNNRLDSYIGLEATKINLIDKLGPRLKDYKNIIFATHGYFGTKLHSVLEPALILTLVPEGTDGFLRMSDVLNMNLNADVVALTACQSGMGKSVSGEGVMGLGRAFQYAGSRTVVMSLWNVSEKPSVMLVESLFRRLKEGYKKPMALKMARDDVRAQGYDHPYFWAGFVLNGDQN